MDRRKPIAPDFKTVEQRQFYHMNHAHAAFVAFQSVFDANEITLRPLFDMVEDNYRRGAAAQQKWDEQLARVATRSDLRWLDSEMSEVQYSCVMLASANAVESGAEMILRAADDLLTSVVVAFTRNEQPLDIGAEVEPGVKIDRLLDAVGNYVRHRQGWRMAHYAGETLTQQNLRSIEPMARVISGDPTLAGSAAYDALIASPMPMLSILDVLSGYTEKHGAGLFDRFRTNICDTAKAIIDNAWPAWWGPRRAILEAAAKREAAAGP